jgi:hypothetical protein
MGRRRRTEGIRWCGNDERTSAERAPTASESMVTLWNGLDKVRWLDPKCTGKLNDIQQPDIAFTRTLPVSILIRHYRRAGQESRSDIRCIFPIRVHDDSSHDDNPPAIT